MEREFRVTAESRARVLDGESTGGWVSLALQIFYPDLFNGTWSLCPDAVDFRGFQLIDIYQDRNAYVNAHGFERPSARDTSGGRAVHDAARSADGKRLGQGDSWTMSGGQWGAWNATYGPRDAAGGPWRCGIQDRRHRSIGDRVLETIDIRRVLEANWTTLGPSCRARFISP